MSEWIAANWEYVLVVIYALENIVKMPQTKYDDILFDMFIELFYVFINYLIYLCDCLMYLYKTTDDFTRLQTTLQDPDDFTRIK